MNNCFGEQIGKYRLIRLLGQGGAASVYLGQHVDLNTEYAIKVWEASVQIAADEARIIASLKHPHIIPVHYFDVDASTGRHFLVMDYASDGNLRQRHPEGMILDPDNVCNYIRQIAAALAHAHQKQIVHCDIKPENMLISQQGDILLSDFGIATMNSARSQSKQQEVYGTVEYMAPEQFQKRPSPKSDQYALAVVAYEWLCGGVPFDGATLAELIQQIRQQRPPSLTQSGISPEIEGVVFRALEKDPDKRFPNVEDFALALADACGIPSIPTPPVSGGLPQHIVSSSGQVVAPSTANPGPVSPVQPPTRRSLRRAFLVAGLAAGLAALGGGGAWWAFSRSGPSACVPSKGQIASDGLITSGVFSWGADPGQGDASVSGAAPYVFYDANGDLAGFEVDIANAIAELMGISQACYPANYKWEIENDLQARKMDVILNGWEITPGRELNENFSDPYYRYSQQLVVRANDPRFSQYTESSQITLTELKSHNYKFGTGTDYKAADLLRNVGINPYTSDKPLDDLNKGIVDIIMIDMPIVAYYVRGIGKGAIPSHTLRPIGKPLFADSMSNYVIGFKKGDPNADMLRQEIRKALSALKQDGTLKRIYQDWGLWNEFQTEIGIVDCV